MRYVKVTSDYGIHYYKHDEIKLNVHSDFDWVVTMMIENPHLENILSLVQDSFHGVRRSKPLFRFHL